MTAILKIQTVDTKLNGCNYETKLKMVGTMLIIPQIKTVNTTIEQIDIETMDIPDTYMVLKKQFMCMGGIIPIEFQAFDWDKIEDDRIIYIKDISIVTINYVDGSLEYLGFLTEKAAQECIDTLETEIDDFYKNYTDFVTTLK